MSKPSKKRYRLSEIRQNAETKKGSVIEFDAPNGQEFSIPAPGFWPDEVYDSVNATDTVAMAKALLGERYEDFRASGGRADDIALLIEAWSADQGTELPKS